MKKTTSIFIVVILHCIFTTVLSQESQSHQTVRGVVVDETTQYPLVGALVSVVDKPELSAITTEQGEFTIHDVPLGRQSFEITYVGYKSQIIPNVLVVSGKESFVHVGLQEHVVETDRVVITAHKPQNEPLNDMSTVSARAISVEQTERFAGSLGDPARMVANYAGVMSKDDSRNDIIIRGNSPIGVLWRINGVEIPNPNHFSTLGSTGGPISMINNNLLATSDFLIGAFPAEYGNAIAGVFDLHLRSGNTYSHEFTGQMGLNGFELGAEGPITTQTAIRPSYLINFRYSTLDVMNAMGLDFGTGAAIPQYKDLTYNITVPTEENGMFKFFGIWGDSYIELGRTDSDASNSYNPHGTATDFGSNTGAYAASHTYFFNKNTSLRTTGSFQSTTISTVFDSVYQDSTLPMHRQNHQQHKISINQKIKYKLTSNLHMSAGYIYDMFTIDYIDSTFQGPERGFETGRDIEEPLGLVQSYVQGEYKPVHNVRLYAGAHTQYFDVNSQMVIEPRAGVEFYLPYNQSLKFGYGIHNQTQIKQIYFHREYINDSQDFIYTNKDIGFTKNTHYVFTYSVPFFTYWRFQTELYYQYVDNVPVSREMPEYSLINSGAEFYVFDIGHLENSGTGTNKGIEITLERHIHDGYYVLATASVFDSKYTDYNNVTRNTAFNNSYVLNFLGGYEYEVSKNLMLTCDIRTTVAGGKPYMPIDIEASNEQNKKVYNMDEIFEYRYDAYFRTDVRIGLKHNGAKFNQEWGLDLQNVTNHQNVFMQDYDASQHEVYTVYQKGFMPMMLYRIQF
ncbi:MAG: TonB-dependent receptor [Bacteroidales bacterium]